MPAKAPVQHADRRAPEGRQLSGRTVERKSGRLSLSDGRPAELVDLPGAYSLDPSSPDEEVTRDVVVGRQQGERLPDALLVVLDATNLDNHLRFALQLIELGLPTVVALNMVDLARRDGLDIDVARLSAELGVPVVETVAVRRRGLDEVKEALSLAVTAEKKSRQTTGDFVAVQRRARAIARSAVTGETGGHRSTQLIDRVALHPVAGPIIFAAIMFFMFQAVSPGPRPRSAGWKACLRPCRARSPISSRKASCAR
jgi:ferrous iron transport protein B